VYDAYFSDLVKPPKPKPTEKMKFQLLSIVSAVALSLPNASVAFAKAPVQDRGTAVRSAVATEVEAPTTVWGVQTDADHEGVLVVKAPLKMLGPYPALGLRFPDLATESQRKTGKSGVSLDFVIDTAANTNTIQRPVQEALEIPKVGRFGSVHNMGGTQLDGVMEDLFLTDLGVSALPGGNPNAAGLLSLAFLKLFPGGVAFGWAEKRPSLTFFAGKTKSATDDKKMVPIQPLTMAGGLPSITLMVNGKEVKALLAAGSPITVMNEEAAKLAGVERMNLAGFDKEDMQANGNIVVVQNQRGEPVDLTRSKDVVDIKAAEVDFGKVPLYVGEIPSLAALTSEFAGPAILLGLDVLVQRPSMLLRAQDNEVWFS